MLAQHRSAWPTLEADNVAVRRGVKEPQSQNAEKHSAFIRPKWSARLSNPVSQLLALKRLVPQRVTDRARDRASSQTNAARCICEPTDRVCQRARGIEMRRWSDLPKLRGDRSMARRNACREPGRTCFDQVSSDARTTRERRENAVRTERREKDRRLDAGASSLRVLVFPCVVDQRRRRPARPAKPRSAIAPGAGSTKLPVKNCTEPPAPLL